MGDPGFGTGDRPVAISANNRAGGEAAEIGADIGFGENGGWQHFAAGDAGQPVGLLCFRSAQRDQLTGDFRAGAQRSRADPAARQLFGDQAHDDLAEAEAAECLGNADPESAKLRHRFHGGIGDQVVGEVPFVGVGEHFGFGELAELVADRVEFAVVEAFARPVAFAQRLRDFHAGRGMVAVEHFARSRPQRAHGIAEAEVHRAEQLVLPHRQTADQLGHGFGEGELGDFFIKRIGIAIGVEPAKHGLQRGNAGGDPGKAMGGALLAVDVARR